MVKHGMDIIKQISVRCNPNQIPVLTEKYGEQIPSLQKAFISQVKNVIDVMEDLGHPLLTGTDLLTLDTKRIMPDSTVNTIRTAENVSKTQYQKFVAERVNADSTAFSDTIHENNLSL